VIVFKRLFAFSEYVPSELVQQYDGSQFSIPVLLPRIVLSVHKPHHIVLKMLNDVLVSLLGKAEPSVKRLFGRRGVPVDALTAEPKIKNDLNSVLYNPRRQSVHETVDVAAGVNFFLRHGTTVVVLTLLNLDFVRFEAFLCQFRLLHFSMLLLLVLHFLFLLGFIGLRDLFFLLLFGFLRLVMLLVIFFGKNHLLSLAELVGMRGSLMMKILRLFFLEWFLLSRHKFDFEGVD